MPPEPNCAVAARALTVEYRRRASWLSTPAPSTILHSVDLSIPHGETWGLTGSSGCGKSTLARCLARWEQPSSGQVFGGAAVQLIVQDPGASLNPRFTAREIIEEPLVIAHRPAGCAPELMRLTGLDPEHAARRASQFSGGERARLAIARAIAALPDSQPGMLIFDESFASLDSEALERVLVLLAALRSRLALTYLVISHERDLLARIATRVLYMSRGRIDARA